MRVTDRDSGCTLLIFFCDGNDEVDDMFIEMPLAPSSTFTAPQVFQGLFQNANLELSFKVQSNSIGKEIVIRELQWNEILCYSVLP